jgi:hypothetical protein
MRPNNTDQKERGSRMIFHLRTGILRKLTSIPTRANWGVSIWCLVDLIRRASSLAAHPPCPWATTCRIPIVTHLSAPKELRLAWNSKVQGIALRLSKVSGLSAVKYLAQISSFFATPTTTPRLILTACCKPILLCTTLPHRSLLLAITTKQYLSSIQTRSSINQLLQSTW